VRRIGVLVPGDENDPEWKNRLSALTKALADLGRIDGRNVRMDVRWYGDDINRMRALSQELVGLQPDIIVTNGTPATAAVQWSSPPSMTKSKYCEATMHPVYHAKITVSTKNFPRSEGRKCGVKGLVQ
jgi:hypothetical protein